MLLGKKSCDGSVNSGEYVNATSSIRVFARLISPTSRNINLPSINYDTLAHLCKCDI